MAENLGKIVISEEVILDWLQFPEGKIRDIRMGRAWATIEIILDHPEMPLVNKGDAIQTVSPLYESIIDERSVAFVIRRVKNGERMVST